MITVNLNGEEHIYQEKILVKELINKFDFDHSYFAVEKNGEIIPASLHDKIFIENNDNFEIVEFIGGG